MKMKRIAVLVCIILFVLCGCKSDDKLAHIGEWENDIVDYRYAEGAMQVQGPGMYGRLSIHEKGAFYINNSFQLSYYDYDSDSCYILCSEPNCTHMNDTCVANAGMASGGFALYGEYAYYVRKVEDSMQWSLIKVDIAQQTRSVVAVFGGEGKSTDEWYTYEILAVDYYGGKAWITQKLYFNSSENTGWTNNGVQLIAIDLETGELNALTEPLMNMRDVGGLYFDAFYGNIAQYRVSYFTEPYMNLLEYCRENGMDSSDPDAVQSFNEYSSEFWENLPEVCEYHTVQIDTMVDSMYSAGPVNSKIAIPFAAWQDRFLGWCYDASGDAEYFWINNQGDRMEDFLSFQDNGYPVSWYTGAVFHLYNEDSILYLLNQEDDRHSYHLLDLNSGESRLLFTQKTGEEMFLLDQTSDKLVGLVDDQSCYAWIYKSDYEKGNFDALHRFSLK